MNSPRALAAAALTVLALAGCGSGDTGDADSASPAPTASSAGTSPSTPSPSATAPATASSAPAATLPAEQPDPTATADLTVEFSADGGTVTDTYQLTCAGAEPLQAEGVPDPATACTQLAEHGAAPFMDQAAGGAVSCTQQIAGMQRAVVTGSVDGEPVESAFSLTDGCQISRWEQLTGLLGPAEGTL